MAIGTTMAAIAAITAATGFAASSIIAANQDAPSPQALPEAPTTAEAETQAQEDLVRRPGAVGAAETVSAGLLTEEADTTKKTLLG